METAVYHDVSQSTPSCQPVLPSNGHCDACQSRGLVWAPGGKAKVLLL